MPEELLAATPTPAPAPANSSPEQSPPSNAPDPGQDLTSVVADKGWKNTLDEYFPEDKPTPPAEPAKPAEKPAETPAKEAEKPAEPPKPSEKPDEDIDLPEPKVGNTREFRNWGKTGWDRFKKASAKAKELEAKIAEIESKPAPTATDDKKLADLTEQLTAAQKRIDDYEMKVRMTRYEESAEYQEKYQKPWMQAVKSAYDDVKELTVTETNAETGDVKERPALQSDFDEIVNSNLGPASKLAHEKFGINAPYILQLRANIRNLARVAHEAVQGYRSTAAERAKAEAVKETQRTQQLNTLWTKANESLAAKAPDLFAERENDKEWNEAFAKGTELVAKKFGPAWNQLPDDQKVMVDAQIFQFARAFLPLRAKMKALTAQLAEKDKMIAQLKGSAPGKPAPAPSSEPPAEPKTWRDALAQHFKD